MVLIKVEASVPAPKSQNDFVCSERYRGRLKSWQMYPHLQMADWTRQGAENRVKCTLLLELKILVTLVSVWIPFMKKEEYPTWLKRVSNVPAHL